MTEVRRRTSCRYLFAIVRFKEACMLFVQLLMAKILQNKQDSSCMAYRRLLAAALQPVDILDSSSVKVYICLSSPAIACFPIKTFTVLTVCSCKSESKTGRQAGKQRPAQRSCRLVFGIFTSSCRLPNVQKGETHARVACHAGPCTTLNMHEVQVQV